MNVRSALRWASLGLHVLLPLAVGCAIYLAYRDPSLLGWSWADALGLDASGLALREGIRSTLGVPPSFVRFVLPDALWVYALTFGVARITRDASRMETAAWLAIPLALGPGAEILQAVAWLPGTFDVADLVATTFAFVAASFSAYYAFARSARSRAARPGATGP